MSPNSPEGKEAYGILIQLDLLKQNLNNLNYDY